MDEALLLTHTAGLSPPTLRLYAWETPTLSLGLLQPFNAEWACRCRRLGGALVRRPSGGGAVWHHHELTYAVVVDGRCCPLGSSVLATYRWLERGLRAALHRLGIEPDPPFDATVSAPAAFCFARLTGADLAVQGRKLCGSAQARRQGVLLQHGTIPLRWNLDAVTALFGEPFVTALTSLEQLLGRSVRFSEVADAVAVGFEQALGIALVPGALTPTEKALAELLVKAKYATPAWTESRTVPADLRCKVQQLLRAESANASLTG